MKRLFTLIELLCVIAVISVLMGILLPALSSVKTKGKEAKAKADMNSIVAACKQYEMDYGVLPNPGVSSGDYAVYPYNASTYSNANSNTPTTYKTLFQLLTGITYFSSTAVTYNIRNTRYLEVPTSYSLSSGNSPSGYADPWGYTYGIALDLNYDGSVAPSYASGAPTSVQLTPVLSSVAVYSAGSNGITGTKYLYSWK